MAEDSRESGRPVSSTVDVASGDSTLVTALELRDEETLSISELKVTYDPGATTNANLMVYDEDSSINDGDQTDKVDTFRLQPGERVNVDMVYSDIENDVLVTTDGNQDDEITVTIGGYVVTG